ncbi:MAG: transposase [Holosporales bacterium]|nr:transposase [Holosporales bacterium]
MRSFRYFLVGDGRTSSASDVIYVKLHRTFRRTLSRFFAPSLTNCIFSRFSKPRPPTDPDVRIGAKSKRKFWIGYKKSVGVDMRSGLINKVAVTKANKTDAHALKHVCPKQGAVIADKGYASCEKIAKTKGIHLCAIKPNNWKGKNKDKDRWLSGLRAPYESVFSKENKRCRYRGLMKNQWTGFMQQGRFLLRRFCTQIV